jgi:DNA-binding NarL/FixJ family response regulator
MSNATKRVRILIVDHHRLVRAGIRALLERIENVEVVGEADDSNQVLQFLRTRRADVVLMENSIPHLDGVEVTRQITQEFPRVKVIIVSTYQDEDCALRALRAGAAGYLLKQADTGELEAALERVRSGDIYVSRHLGAFTEPNSGQNHSHRSLDKLTTRQREILQLLAEGHTTKGIAYDLRVSPKTVEYHRAQIMDRLGIRDLPGLVRFALRVGLVGAEN